MTTWGLFSTWQLRRTWWAGAAEYIFIGLFCSELHGEPLSFFAPVL
jgi:hypothetical protein